MTQRSNAVPRPDRRRQRNVADKVAREWAERRAAAEAAEREVDLDRASAEAEVELLDPAARRPSRTRRIAAATATGAGRARLAAPAARPAAGPEPRHGAGRPPCRTSPRCRGCSTARARSPRLRERLGPASRRPGCTGGTSA